MLSALCVDNMGVGASDTTLRIEGQGYAMPMFLYALKEVKSHLAEIYSMSQGELSSVHMIESRVDNSFGIRPVINLKANVEISGGVGTKNNPYQISTT